MRENPTARSNFTAVRLAGDLLSGMFMGWQGRNRPASHYMNRLNDLTEARHMLSRRFRLEHDDNNRFMRPEDLDVTSVQVNNEEVLSARTFDFKLNVSCTVHNLH